MKVSVIIPAYNAAATIEEALASVVAQTAAGWEVIVINDGSTDATSRIARRLAAADNRIRVTTQKNKGESGARNTGIKRARHEWLIFLDADDWIAPNYIDRMSVVLAGDPSLDAVHCGWARVASDGSRVTEAYRPPAGRLFHVLARRAAFPIHACMVRKTLVDSVGGFDTSLRTCPDWDLWQRIARAGARFGSVPEILASYRMAPNSASLDAAQLLRDGLRVLRTGHTSDPRVTNPDPEFAGGLAGSTVESQEFYLLAWNAGLMLGAGHDPRRLLEVAGSDIYPELHARGIAQALFESATLPSSQGWQAWEDLWPRFAGPSAQFLEALEATSRAPGLAVDALLELKRLVLKNSITWRDVIELHERDAAQLQNARTHLDELDERAATLAGVEAELTAALDQARGRAGAMERAKRSAEEVLAESRRYAEGLTRRSAELVADLEVSRAKAQALESEKASIEVHLEVARAQAARLTTESTELAAVVDAAMKNADVRREALERENESTTALLEESRRQAAGLEKESAELAAALDETRSQVQLLASQKDSAEAALEAARGEVVNLKRENEAATELLDESRRRAAGLEKESAELAEALDETRSQAQLLASQRASAEAALEAARGEAVNLKRENDSTTELLDESRRQAASLEKESTAQAASLDRVLSQAQRLASEKAAAEADLKTARGEVASLKSRSGALNTTLNNAQARAEALKRENESTAAALTAARVAAEAEKASAETIAKEQAKTIEALEERLRTALQRGHELEQREIVLDAELGALRQRVAQVEGERDHLTSESGKWRQASEERAHFIEEIQQDAWVRLGSKLGIVKPREVPPATQAISPMQGIPGEEAPEDREDAASSWDLRVDPGNEAHVIYPGHDHEMVCVGITKTGTPNDWDIQLNKRGITVRAGGNYLIAFRARAARPRSIGVGFAKAHDPWSTLGFYRKLRLMREWQTFREEFTALEDDDNTRIHFDLGAKAAGVDITTVVLREVESSAIGSEPEMENTFAEGQPA